MPPQVGRAGDTGPVVIKQAPDGVQEPKSRDLEKKPNAQQKDLSDTGTTWFHQLRNEPNGIQKADQCN